MKTKLLAILALFCFSVSSCYDDGELRSQLSDHESRISALETLCKQMNTNISSLQTIVEALQKNDYITSITPIKEGDDTIGYTINFTKGEAVTIYHGQDGHSPKMSVQKHSDGTYYWILDGEWLLDDAGNKIKAAGTDGIDGITPQLKIEEDYWYISYDNGATWKQLCKAVGEDGDAFFQSVAQDETSVTFTLTDGTSITLPKIIDFNVAFDKVTGILCLAGEIVSIPFTVTGATAEINVECIENNGWKATAAMISETKGEIKVTAPDPIVDGKVLVLVSNGNEQVVLKALTFEEKRLSMVTDSYQVSEAGGIIEIPVTTNMEYAVNIPADAQGWLSHTATKAVRTDMLVFSATENPDEAPRIADVNVTSVDGAMSFTLTITQKAQPSSAVIEFADAVMKLLCTAAFDTNNDGELSYKEAAAVSDLSQMLLTKTTFKSFDEFQYFVNVKEIPSGYFSNSSISSIVFPESLEMIGESAFSYCTNLSTIDVPKNVNVIASAAFRGCTNLTSILLPEALGSICAYAFAETGLRSITIPDNVTEIDEYAFHKSYLNTSVVLPDNLLTIGNYAFASTSILSISLPEKLSHIGNHAFYECGSLYSINIPSGIDSIEHHTFSYTALQEVVIPSSVLHIGESAFDGCFELASITFPASVQTIGCNAFRGVGSYAGSEFCGKQCKVYIDNLLHWLKISEQFSTSAGEYQYNSPVNEMTVLLYINNDLVTDITIPDEINIINDFTFYGWPPLQSMFIPDSVIYIGKDVFPSLNSIYFMAHTPPAISSDIFCGNVSDVKIYVPADAVETYKTASGWSQYADSIVGYDYENETVVE